MALNVAGVPVSCAGFVPATDVSGSVTDVVVNPAEIVAGVTPTFLYKSFVAQ